MKAILFFTCCALPLVFISCQGGSSSAKAQADSLQAQTMRKASPPKTQFVEAVKVAEANMRSSKAYDPQIAAALIKAYIGYANEFPNDTLAPDYLFRAGGLATEAGNYDQAIFLYNEVAEKFPEYKYVVEAQYLEAMIYDTNLPGQDAKAKVIYEKIIKDYPKNKLAADAKAAIGNLGKTDDELVKEFEKKNTHSK
jgi:TolA-binding protein